MTVALWCVMVAGLLPVLCVGLAKATVGGYDNRSPRAWLSQLQGWPARANAAQQNSWEAFAVFAAGVFSAHLAHAPQLRVDQLAVAFIVVRLLYIVCYLGNVATLRSLVWTAGLALSIALFAAGA